MKVQVVLLGALFCLAAEDGSKPTQIAATMNQSALHGATVFDRLN